MSQTTVTGDHQRLWKHIEFDLPDPVVRILNLALSRTGDDPSEMFRKQTGIFSRNDLGSEISNLRFPIPANDLERSNMVDSKVSAKKIPT